jgi:hypothetical protein
MNNPYLTAALGVPQAWVAVFLFDKLQGQIGLAIGVAAFFMLGAVVTFVFAVIRIPGWHRSRRIAKEWVMQHGGEIPPELRWYT